MGSYMIIHAIEKSFVNKRVLSNIFRPRPSVTPDPRRTDSPRELENTR